MAHHHHDKAMSWGYGIGLLALLITTAIGLYIWAKTAETIAPTSNPADNIYNQVLKQTQEIQEALDEHARQVRRQAERAADSATPAAGATTPASAKTTFDVVLISPGPWPKKVIEVVRKATGLDEARAADLVNSAPMGVRTALDRRQAERLKAQLEAAGAKVELR